MEEKEKKLEEEKQKQKNKQLDDLDEIDYEEERIMKQEMEKRRKTAESKGKRWQKNKKRKIWELY